MCLCRYNSYICYLISGAKNLPLEHNTLIHFDSHPDLLLPADLSPQDAFDKFKLFQKLSIENWILPGVFVGVLKTIIWVCPWWSQQIQPGEYSFEVGKTKDNKLAVTCLEAYYISEGLFTSRDNLEDTKEVNLIVIKLDENDENMRGLRDQLLSVEQQIAEVGHYILDFDLDFFSTLNPFISLYSEAGLYQKLRDLYSIGPVPHNLETPAKIEMAMKSTKDRTELLEKLKNIFEFLSTDENLSMYEGPGEDLTGVVSDIVLSVRKHYPREEVDWRLVHDAGCTFDDSELPHHISSPAQILSLLRMTETLLDLLGQPPTIVTMSRSSQDDYCPPHQVEEIQAGLLNLLKIKFGNIAEHHCYRED